MFVYQNGKLYIQNGENLVGVNIYPDFIKKVNGTQTKEIPTRMVLTYSEVIAKFNITGETPYIFPKEKVKEKKEVIKDATSKTKKPTGKSKRK